MSRFSFRTKRRASIALLVFMPLLLFAILREKHSWQPRTLPIKNGINQILWMPDGKTLLVQTEKQLQFWDVDKKVSSRTLNLETAPNSLKLLPDSLLTYRKSQLMGDDWVDDGFTYIWDLNKKKRVLALPYNDATVISSTQKRVALVRVDVKRIEIKYFQIPSGHLLKTVFLALPKNVPSDSHFGPYYNFTDDFSIVAVAQQATHHHSDDRNALYDEDEGILFFNAQTGHYLRYLHDPKCLSYFFANNDTLITYEKWNLCQLHDVVAAKLKTTIYYINNDALVLQLTSGSQKRLLGWAPQECHHIYIWNTSTGAISRIIQVNDTILSIAPSPDGATLAVATQNSVNLSQNSVKLYRMR